MAKNNSVPAVRNNTSTVSDARKKDLLKRLAAETSIMEAASMLPEELPHDTLEILVFRLGAERYGLDIRSIVQIVRFQEPAPVPHTVSFLDGIISLRGQMIPVINGRKRLGHDPVTPDRKTRIIVVRDAAEFQGILVDSTTQVLRIGKETIESTPPVVGGIRAEFIEGVCYHKGQLIILLNLDRFLQLV